MFNNQRGKGERVRNKTKNLTLQIPPSRFPKQTKFSQWSSLLAQASLNPPHSY